MKNMPVKKFVVTIARQVVETVTLQIDAPSRQDAAMKAGQTLKDQDWEWHREVGDARVASVEIARAEADPMDVPPLLQRAAAS